MRSSPSIERPTDLDDASEDRTIRTKALDAEDLTRMASVDEPATKAARVFTPPGTEHQRVSNEMLEELRRRLRAAEAREEALGSGIRERPTPEDGLPAGLRDTVVTPPPPRPDPDLFDRDLDLDPLADLEIDVDAARTLGEWADMLDSPQEIEVSVAPHSESNFYGGFDEEYPDGVFVATYQAVATGTPVYAVVHLPGGYRFRSPALVEFARPPEYATPDAPPGVGLRMCGLDGRMRRLIREFVKHRPPMFYIG